jgi:hypothetical protein
MINEKYAHVELQLWVLQDIKNFIINIDRFYRYKSLKNSVKEKHVSNKMRCEEF